MNVHSKCHATRDSAHARGARVGLCGLSLLLGLGLGCGGSDDKPGGEVSQPDAEAAPVADAGGDAGAPSGPQLAVSADFLNQTLSIFDVNALAEGKTRADVLVGTVDLSAYSPGPLSLAVTPDGKMALVSISRGFFNFFITVPPGDGTVLFVDLAERKVVGELFTGKVPMGIAITPDGKRAFVGHFSEDYIAVVDIEKRTFEKLTTGQQYNEEMAIDDSGSSLILTYGPAGNVKTFSLADPFGSNGQTDGLNGDAAGTAFFPGTKIAYLVQAPTSLNGNIGGHDLVDVSDPKSPIASDSVRIDAAPTVYPVTAVTARGSVAFPRTQDNMLALTEMKLSDGKASEVQTVQVGAAKSLAYGVTSTRDGRVLLSVSGEHYIAVVDLATKKAFTVPWEVSMSGPTETRLIP
jgi:DNA-binding beta-propeller fold protein YncE